MLIFISIFSSCSIKTISYYDFELQQKEFAESSYNLVIDEEPIPKDTLNFYLRHLKADIIKEIEILPKRLNAKYGYQKECKVHHIKTVVYQGIIKRDINFFRENYSSSIWVIDGFPYIKGGILLKDKLKSDLRNIDASQILKIKFIFPEMSNELYGSGASGGMVILNTL